MASVSTRGVPVSFGSPKFDTIACDPFLVTNAVFPAEHRIGKHFHDRTVLGVTVAGEWDSIVGATRLANSPAMLHVEPAGDCHVNQFGVQAAEVVVIQPDQTNTLLEPFKSLLATAFQMRVGFSGLHIAEQLRRELCCQDDLSPLAVETLCLELLVAASRSQRVSNGPAPAWLLRTVDYAHAQFLERPSLAELGKIAGVSPEHFKIEIYQAEPIVGAIVK